MKKILIFLILNFTVIQALGFDIKIDPKGYLGDYQILGESGVFSGPAVVSLEEGTHWLLVGALSSFKVIIDGTGSVVIEDHVPASVVSNQIVFNNVAISIDTSLYKGDWRLPSVRKTSVGPIKEVIVVPGLNYLFQVASIDGFIFFVDQVGVISGVTNEVAATAVGNTLGLNTTKVDIHSGEYAGEWRIPSVLNLSSSSFSNLFLVDGLRYQIQIAAVGVFNILIKSGGLVKVENGISASGGLNFLTLNTMSLDFSSENYVGDWLLPHVGSWTAGSLENVVLVPGVKYRLSLASNKFTDFAVAESCEAMSGAVAVESNIFSVTCSKKTEPSCEDVLNYDMGVKCSGRYIARNQDDLDSYLSDFGKRKSKYRSLIIDFDISLQAVNIYSPCKIKLRKNRKISGAKVCIAGRKGVKISKNAQISSDFLGLISKSGKVKISKKALIRTDILEINSFGKNIFRRH